MVVIPRDAQRTTEGHRLARSPIRRAGAKGIPDGRWISRRGPAATAATAVDPVGRNPTWLLPLRMGTILGGPARPSCVGFSRRIWIVG